MSWSARAEKRLRFTALIGLLLFPFTTADADAAAKTTVVNLLIDPDGLPALHNSIGEDGEPNMWLPQLRLFDTEGRPLWAPARLPPSKKEFRRELAARIENPQRLAEERTLRQEGRHLLRRGGLPLNLTTLPEADLTVIEYWTDECGQCEDMKAEMDRYFNRAEGLSALILRVFIDLGTRQPDG